MVRKAVQVRTQLAQAHAGAHRRRVVHDVQVALREVHDALKRRCLYYWIDYPRPERELEIVRRRVKGASESLAVQVADTIARIRASDVQKPPGIAEAIDWLAALSALGITELDESAAERTLGSVLKYREDQELVRAAGLARMVS